MAQRPLPTLWNKMSPTLQKRWWAGNRKGQPFPSQGLSVAQSKKDEKPSERVKKLQTASLKAYGATKGAKVGGEHGSEEMRDTIAPLTRDQHSKVQAAERAAKAAAARATPKRTKPLSQSERMAAIAAAVRKAKAKHDVPTVDPDDMDHDDLRDVHNQLHVGRGTYSEATDRLALIKSIAAKKTMNKPMRFTKKPEPLSKTIARHKYVSHIDDVTGYDVKSKDKGMNRFEEIELEEGVATAQKVMDRANVVAKTNPDPKKRFAASGLAQKAMLRTINPTGVNTGIVRGGGNKTYRMSGKIPPYQLTKKTGVSEEVELDEAKKPLKPSYWRAEWRLGTKSEVDKNNKKIYDRLAKSDPAKAKAFHDNLVKMRKEDVDQIDELKSSTLQSYLDKRPAPKFKDIARKETVGKPEERQKDIERANLTRIGRARAKAKLLKRNPPPRTAPQYDPNDRGYGQGRYMGDSVNLEGQVMNEVSKKEAEAVLGGPTKQKPKGPAGKLPLGFRLARSAARRAMKGQINAVHKSMEKTMAKEEVELVEQDDSMEKKEMAQTQLHFMAYAAKEILEFIDMGGEIEEWYQNKLSKVQSEVESLHSYIEGEKRRTGMVKEEEQIDEKAPPGAKYERMVKHIKKGYAKGGLTPKEKSIAYATAWKAYGKKNEEVEQIDERNMENKAKKKAVSTTSQGFKKGSSITEAEGTVAVTPKEKALAAHHGDPKKITYGDVIKARLKSVAAKKMGKK